MRALSILIKSENGCFAMAPPNDSFISKTYALLIGDWCDKWKESEILKPGLARMLICIFNTFTDTRWPWFEEKRPIQHL